MDVKSLIPFGRGRTVAEGDPFSAMRREMERVFDSFTRDWNLPSSPATTGFLSPKVDLTETEAGVELTAELPGIDPKDIDLDISKGVLTLKAEHKTEKEEKDEKKQFHLVERSYGTYMRRFALPFEADEGKIAASFENGVLKVTIPRSAEAKEAAKKIAIQSK